MNPIRLAAAALVALLPAAFPATAEAQTLAACYIPKSGTVYRIQTPGAPSKCSQNHVQFTWSAQGETGPQGPEGPAGPEGPQGSAANVTISRLERSMTAIGPGWSANPTLVCPNAGDVAVGGGWRPNGPAVGLRVYGSYPSGEGDWTFVLANEGAVDFTVGLWIICVGS